MEGRMTGSSELIRGARKLAREFEKREQTFFERNNVLRTKNFKYLIGGEDDLRELEHAVYVLPLIIKSDIPEGLKSSVLVQRLYRSILIRPKKGKFSHVEFMEGVQYNEIDRTTKSMQERDNFTKIELMEHEVDYSAFYKGRTYWVSKSSPFK